MGTRRRHSAETIARLRERGLAQFSDPEKRRAHGDLTRARMAEKRPELADLRRLDDAWAIASPNARTRFLRDLFASICKGEP